MKLIKRINLNQKYTAKDGKEYTSVNYYLELDNGQWVAIAPVFKKSYYTLDAVAEVVKNGKEE